MSKTTSKTVRDTNLVERLTGSHHYKTTISDGKTRAEGLGRSREEAEKRASTRWDNVKKK
jgi:dsRNA-specific ribonuclease